MEITITDKRLQFELGAVLKRYNTTHDKKISMNYLIEKFLIDYLDNVCKD